MATSDCVDRVTFGEATNFVDLKSRDYARDGIAGDEEEKRREDSPNACMSTFFYAS